MMLMMRIVVIGMLVLVCNGYTMLSTKKYSALKPTMQPHLPTNFQHSPQNSFHSRSVEGSERNKHRHAASSTGSIPRELVSRRRRILIDVAEKLTTLFPVWTVLFATLGVFKPSLFSFFTTDYFTASLGATFT